MALGLTGMNWRDNIDRQFYQNGLDPNGARVPFPLQPPDIPNVPGQMRLAGVPYIPWNEAEMMRRYVRTYEGGRYTANEIREGLRTIRQGQWIQRNPAGVAYNQFARRYNNGVYRMRGVHEPIRQGAEIATYWPTPDSIMTRGYRDPFFKTSPGTDFRKHIPPSLALSNIRSRSNSRVSSRASYFMQGKSPLNLPPRMRQYSSRARASRMRRLQSRRPTMGTAGRRTMLGMIRKKKKKKKYT